MKNTEDLKTLNETKTGETVTVRGLRAEGAMRRRLQDVGFCEGTRVKCMMKSPLGDPTAYLVRGTLIALRKEDSALISVGK